MKRFVQSLTLGLASSLSVLAVQSVQAHEVSDLETESSQTLKLTAATPQRSVTLLEVTDLLPQARSETIPTPAKITDPIPTSSIPFNTATKTPTPAIKDLPPVSTQAADLMAQDTSTNDQVVKVTGVNIQSTATGIEIQLAVPAADSLPSSTQVEGNTLITKIENAVLALPGGQPFRQQNPAAGITEVTVSQIQPTQIQVRVTGVEAAPVVSLSTGTEGVILTATPGVGEEEETEITVTAEKVEEGYRVPNASTATKTDTPIRDTPASIQVVPQQVIKDQQVTRLEEALRNVSGVTFIGNDDGRQASFRLRGFGPGATEGSGTPILRDGFRIYGFQGFPEVANLEQVEVLKGPASILYGEIEPGGVINLVSKQPLDEPFYGLELQVGSRSLVRPQIDFSGPLTTDGKLLYRLNALYQYKDTFRDYDSESNRVSIAPTLTWKIGDRTQLTTRLEYIKDSGPADFGLTAFGDRVADIPRSRITNNPDDTIDNNYLSIGYNLEHQFNDNWTIRNAFRFLSYRYDYSLLALPFEIDDTTGILTRFFADQESDINSYSLQTNAVGKFKTGSIQHTLVVGIDLNKTDSRNLTTFGDADSIDIFNPVYGSEPDPATLPVLFDTQDTTNRLGVYLQDQVALLDNLFILAGIRYDTIDQTITNSPSIFDPTGSEQSQTLDDFIPRFGILYRPIPQLSLYGSYSRSFLPNTGTTASGDPLAPERGEGFEVGVKADLIKDRLLATLAYFDITKRNVAVADPINFGASIATGEQHSQGLEFDLSGEILPGWNVIGSWTYNDAEITNDTDLTLISSRLPNIPRHAASLWTTYEIQAGVLQGLGFGAGFNFVGDRQGGLPNSFTVDSYFVANAALFYHRDNWRVALNFKNLFDANYIEAVDASRTRGIYAGEPFTVIGSVSVEF
jgi:iron complex outermembrane receptor protein